MRLKWLLILSITVLSLHACKDTPEGPKVTVYISSPGSGGMDYYDAEGNEGGFVTYAETDHFICMKPADANRVIRFYATGKDEEKPETPKPMEKKK